MRYPQNSILNRLRFCLDKNLRMANLTEAALAAHGEKEAFRTDGPLQHLGVNGNALNYRDVHEIVGRMAQLLKQAGLRRFARVAIYKANSIDYFLMGLAVMRAGGIAVPVHGRLNPNDFTQYANYCGCEMVYTDADNFSRLNSAAFPLVKKWIFPTAPEASLQQPIVLAHDLNDSVPIADAVATNVHDDALIVHTSGTTGFPKGVLHSSYSLIRACRAQLLLNPVPMGERGLSAAHQNHHISFTGLQLSLMAGAWMYVATDLSARSLLETMQREKTNIFFAFPDIYLGMYLEGMHKYDLTAMKAWFSGGDAMHEVHIRACVEQGHLNILGWRKKGSLFFEFLGTSEVGSAALTKISSRKTQLYSRCVGKPTFVGPKVKVADAQGNPLPRGEVGRLMVKGPTLFKGYWNLHEKLHGVVVDGWWWTGDMAHQDEKGRYYQIDREVDVVNTANGPVYGLPLEEELLKCDDVAEAAVIGLPHPQLGEVAVAICHSRSGQPLNTSALLKAIDSRMHARGPIGARTSEQQSGQSASGLFGIIDIGDAKSLPRGLTGKVLKRRLREQHTGWFDAEGAPAATFSESETTQHGGMTAMASAS